MRAVREVFVLTENKIRAAVARKGIKIVNLLHVVKLVNLLHFPKAIVRNVVRVVTVRYRCCQSRYHYR